MFDAAWQLISSLMLDYTAAMQTDLIRGQYNFNKQRKERAPSITDRL